MAWLCRRYPGERALPMIRPGKSERTSLRARAAGRGTPGRKSGAARDRAERGTHRDREGASMPHPRAHPTSYADLRSALLMTSSALSAASCRERLERCA